MLKSSSALLSLLLVIPAFGAELNVDLPGHAGLVLDVPQGWLAQVRRSAPDLPPTIDIVTADAKALRVLIAPVWPTGNAKAPTEKDLHSLVQTALVQAKPKAIEADLSLKDLLASGKSGYYFEATERQPEPGGFTHLTQGTMGLNELRITFTVLVGDNAQGLASQALEMLRSVRRIPARPGA